MPKCCINFLASPTLTVLTPAPHTVFCKRQIPSCMSLSKPIAQHFHYLSSAEKDLSAADIHRCGLIVCCVHQEGWFGFAVPLCGASPLAGVWRGLGCAVVLQWLCCSQEGTGLRQQETPRSSQVGCSRDAFNQPCLAGVP